MIARYAVVAGRIRQELTEPGQVVARAERAGKDARRQTEDQDLSPLKVINNLLM